MLPITSNDLWKLLSKREQEALLFLAGFDELEGIDPKVFAELSAKGYVTVGSPDGWYGNDFGITPTGLEVVSARRGVSSAPVPVPEGGEGLELETTYITLNTCRNEILDLRAQLAALLQHMARLEAALAFYADRENYELAPDGLGHTLSQADMDSGIIAREALAPTVAAPSDKVGK